MAFLSGYNQAVDYAKDQLSFFDGWPACVKSKMVTGTWGLCITWSTARTEKPTLINSLESDACPQQISTAKGC